MWFRSSKKNRRGTPAASRPRLTRPQLEVLEDRTVPSTFNFTDFSSVSSLNLQGSAASSNNRLRLTPARSDLNGSAWYNVEKPLVADHFQTTFQFQLSGGSDGPNGSDGSDGFTFVIQNSSPTALSGSSVATAVARPLEVTAITLGLLEDHDVPWSGNVTSALLPSA